MTENVPFFSSEEVPANTPDADLAEFQAFQAWKARHGAAIESPLPQPTPILNPPAGQSDPGVERGQLETAIRSGQIDPALLQSLLKRLDDLESAAKNQNAANPDAPEGGAPVPHHLHLADGTVVTDHPGLATHYAGPDGVLTRVVSAFPVTPTNPV
jgi:hypothetical protein